MEPWNNDVQVAMVNDAAIATIPFEAGNVAQEGVCQVATGGLDLKALTEHFRRGINTFTLASGAQRAEVILDIEM